METIKIQGIDEEIYFVTSKKGLPIYIWKDPYAKSFYLSLNIRYGSVDTEFSIKNQKYKVPNGIAHFMEHVKFHVKKGITANDLFDPLGSDINAFTSFLYTSYVVFGINKLEDNLNNLLDFVYNPYFTRDIINNERGIIASEIKMRQDQPYNKLYFEFNKSMFVNLKYKDLISGEVEDIKNIKLNDIKLIYDTFYHPENSFLIITGNVNPYEIEEIVNKNLDTKKFNKYLNPVILNKKEPSHVNQKEKNMEAFVEVSKAKIGLKLDKKLFKKYDDVKLNVLFSIILNSNFGDTSDLKEKLLQDGLITFMESARTILEDYIIVDITIESNYVDEAVKKVCSALGKLKINEIDLKRKINSAIATLVTSYDSCEQVNSLLQNYLVYYKKIISNLKEIYEEISLEEVKDVISKINTKEMTIVKMKKVCK